jgi:alkyl hydroperoxide reductase subunit AhpC
VPAAGIELIKGFQRFLTQILDQYRRRSQLCLQTTTKYQTSYRSHSKMLTVGENFPSFDLTAVVNLDPQKAFEQITEQSYPGKWKVVFFWPKDFTFVCPTEIAAFGKLNQEFLDRDAQLLGASIDSEFVHLAWRNNHADLKDLPFPMLSDIKRDLSEQLGILDIKAGVSQRATFIVDPQNVIRFVYVTDLSVGRNPQEVLRVLDALQTDELCPCNWKKGEETLTTK